MCLFAIEQLADRSFAAANRTGDRIEILGRGFEIAGQLPQILDDLAHVLTIFTERAVEGVGDFLDRRGELRNLVSQLRGDLARVRESGIDIGAIRGYQLANLSRDLLDVFDNL